MKTLLLFDPTRSDDQDNLLPIGTLTKKHCCLESNNYRSRWSYNKRNYSELVFISTLLRNRVRNLYIPIYFVVFFTNFFFWGYLCVICTILLPCLHFYNRVYTKHRLLANLIVCVITNIDVKRRHFTVVPSDKHAHLSLFFINNF